MNKFFLGAIGLLALASCSNDDLINANHDGDEIAFNVVTNPVSRANDVYCNNNKPPQFTVWATHNNAQYIDGDNIVFNTATSKWENTTGNRYWPDGNVTFFAHHNAGTAFKYNNGSPIIENFTVAADVANQTDLIYAVKTQSRPTEGNQVTLNFRHALSQIVFQAKNTNQNLYVEISGVSVCKVKNNNTFTYPTADTDNNIAHPNGTMGEYDTSWGTWGNAATGSEKYSVNFAPVELVGNTEATAKSLTVTPDAGKEFNSNAMLLLPQTSTAWDAKDTTTKPGDQDNTYFLVKCQIWNVAGDAVDKSKDVCLWGKDGAKDVAIPVALDWKQGKKYIYTFVFGDGNGGYDPEGPNPVLLPITFNVTVDEFVPVENQNIDMDEPKSEPTPAA